MSEPGWQPIFIDFQRDRPYIPVSRDKRPAALRPGRPRPVYPVRPEWPTLGDDELLDLRFCQLGLTLDGSPLEPRIGQLADELAARGIPVGGELEYVDAGTLARALMDRR